MKTATTILAVGGLAAASGVAYYVWLHRTKSSSSSSGSGSSGSSSGSGSSGSGSGSGSSGSGSGSGSSGSGSASGSSDSTSSHQQVKLSAPSSAAARHPVKVTAAISTLSNPVYQFRYFEPGIGWQQTSYHVGNVGYFWPATSGTYHVIAYARSASAPTGEDASQRAQYEYYSAPQTITVS